MPKRPSLMERRDGVIGTSRWLAAIASSARAEGHSEVMVKIKDLTELTAFMDAVERLQIKEQANIRIGYCRSDKAREMMSNSRTMFSTINHKTDVYDTEVFIARPTKVSAVESDTV